MLTFIGISLREPNFPDTDDDSGGAYRRAARIALDNKFAPRPVPPLYRNDKVVGWHLKSLDRE
jgi:hypothetical protein